MGREKECRQRQKYQVSCVRRKTLESQIAVQLREELGLSAGEARLLVARMAVWLQGGQGLRGPNQILLEATAGRDRYVRSGRGSRAKVTL